MSAEAGHQNSPRASMPSNNEIFRNYYTENDIFSPEGILKLLAIVTCVVSAVLHLSSGSCGAAPVGAAALAAAAAEALLAAARALEVPLLAPQLFLYVEIVVSTSAGVLLLATGVLGLTLCDLTAVVDYFHGPLAIAASVMLVSSAALAYRAAMRLWDAAAGAAPAPEPRPPPATELEA